MYGNRSTETRLPRSRSHIVNNQECGTFRSGMHDEDCSNSCLHATQSAHISANCLSNPVYRRHRYRKLGFDRITDFAAVLESTPTKKQSMAPGGGLLLRFLRP